MDGEPFKDHEAKRRIKAILNSGRVVYSAHAEAGMKKRNLSRLEIANILRGGRVEPAEEKAGRWTYRVRTNTMYAVVGFLSEDSLRIVTAWRIDR